MSQTGKRRKMSKTMLLHYWKLFFRSGLFLTATAFYIINRVKYTGSSFGGMEHNNIILSVIWLVFVVEMVLRFVPSKLESMGCQKQFRRNYKATDADKSEAELMPAWRTALVAGAWFLLNGLIGILYFIHVIDAGVLLLISLAYSVCDMICILFFCPFHSWIMKNKCCISCRIYNWDYAMMFTPLIFVPNFFSWSLVFVAVVLLIKWEIAAHRHPERFFEKNNASLSCANCEEKLCHHKKSLQRFLKNQKRLLIDEHLKKDFHR